MSPGSPPEGMPSAPVGLGALDPSRRLSLPPRLLVAGSRSGDGKTTLTVGLLGALRRRGLRLASAKVGPDYLDPAYHALVTGRPAQNLDGVLAGVDGLRPLAALAGRGADLLLVEGVMGLFDGRLDAVDPRLPAGSSAEVAVALEAPVLLVVDAGRQATTLAATVEGLARFQPSVHVGGVVATNVASPDHADALRRALETTSVPFLGWLPRDPELAWPARHLGLVPPAEQGPELCRQVDRLTTLVEGAVDLARVVALARQAPPTTALVPRPARRTGTARLAVASGPAFGFLYEDNLRRLQEAGAELCPFDPLEAERLPENVHGLYAAGGFPEVFAERLAANRPLLRELRRAAAHGLPIWAECGGLLWLAESLDGHRLAGVVPTRATMTSRLTVGYRTARLGRPSPLGPAGLELVGHEFHYSTTEPPGDGMELVARGRRRRSGFVEAGICASYLHLHLGVDTRPAESFVAAADRWRREVAPDIGGHGAENGRQSGGATDPSAGRRNSGAR